MNPLCATYSFPCVQDSEAPFSGLAEGFPDPEMASLLRAELGLSSADLFSMTVTDYDLKRAVSTRLLRTVP